MKETIVIGNDTFDYDPSLFDDDRSKIDEEKLIRNFVQLALETALSSLHAGSSSSGSSSTGDGYRSIMGSLEILFRESYKFIRLADDIHFMKDILNDIRICFIALTISGYVGIFIYVILVCLNRRNNQSQRDKEDELMFRKWSRLDRSPTIRTPEVYREDEITGNEATTFYCPRPAHHHGLSPRNNLPYGMTTLERKETKPLLINDSFGTTSSMTGSTVRENGGISTGTGIERERAPSFPLPAPVLSS